MKHDICLELSYLASCRADTCMEALYYSTQSHLVNHAKNDSRSLKIACLLGVCIATFEPLIQVKSEAVDTGRELVSRAHAQISEDLVLCEHGVDAAMHSACAMLKETPRRRLADFVMELA